VRFRQEENSVHGNIWSRRNRRPINHEDHEGHEEKKVIAHFCGEAAFVHFVVEISSATWFDATVNLKTVGRDDLCFFHPVRGKIFQKHNMSFTVPWSPAGVGQEVMRTPYQIRRRTGI